MGGGDRKLDWSNSCPEFCPQLYHAVMGNHQAGGKAAEEEGRKTGLDLHFWLVFHQVPCGGNDLVNLDGMAKIKCFDGYQ